MAGNRGWEMLQQGAVVWWWLGWHLDGDSAGDMVEDGAGTLGMMPDEAARWGLAEAIPL